jgi:hypothetical protein
MGKAQNVSEEKIFLNLDRKRELKVNLYAMIEYEKLSGETFLDGVEKLLQNIKKPSMVLINRLLYCCLKHDDPELTEEKTSRLFGMKELSEIKSSLVAGIKNGLPDSEDTEDINKEKGMIPGKASKNE